MAKELVVRTPASREEQPGRLEPPRPLRHGARVGDVTVTISLADIEAARRLLAGVVVNTPMLPAPKLSALTGAQVHVKYENLQITNSFKDRGALNKLSSLSEAERARGVIAMSAGNHAQAVAYHAQRLGIPAIIVMPEMTPFVKVAATRSYGAKVVLHGESVNDAQARVEELVAEHGYVQVHPFADPHIIAGQGTIALEMLEAAADLEVMIFPIGGGGLIAGNAIAARARKPEIEIVGVETALYPSMWNALHGEKRAAGGPTLAEGIAVKEVSGLTVAIARELVSDVLLVEEPDLERAVHAFATLQKTVAEGAGAAGLAALLANKERFAGRKVGLVLTGGNIDPRILASITVRELERESRIVSFRLTMPDRPGELAKIAGTLGALGANIMEVDHHRLFLDVPAKGAKLDVTVETRDAAHAEEILAALAAAGYRPVRLVAGSSRE